MTRIAFFLIVLITASPAIAQDAFVAQIGAGAVRVSVPPQDPLPGIYLNTDVSVSAPVFESSVLEESFGLLPAPPKSGATARLRQDGRDHQVFIQQSGRQAAVVTQSGAGNTAAVTQSGDLNRAVIDQAGTEAQGLVAQNGISNSAVLIQR